MARQADHADVVGEVFTAKLRAEAEVLGFLEQLLFELNVAERLAVFVAFRWQRVVVARGSQLHGFQRGFRRGSADNKRDMVRRARRGAEGAHLLNQVIFQLSRGDQRFGFLVEIGFVGRAAAFCHAQEFVLIAVNAVEVNLRRQVGAGVHLFIHIQRRVLGVAQVVFNVGVVHALAQCRFVTAAGPDALAFFTHDDRRAGILAGWQHAFSGDFRVTQELQGNVLIVLARFRVVKNGCNLLLVGRTQHKCGVVEGLLRQQGQRFRLHFQHFLAFELGNGNVLFGQQIVFGVVVRQWEGVLIKKRFV